MPRSQVQGLFWTRWTTAILPVKVFYKTIENLSYKVKWRRSALLHFSKKSNKTGKIPVLWKPTHMKPLKLVDFFYTCHEGITERISYRNGFPTEFLTIFITNFLTDFQTNFWKNFPNNFPIDFPTDFLADFPINFPTDFTKDFPKNYPMNFPTDFIKDFHKFGSLWKFVQKCKLSNLRHPCRGWSNKTFCWM